jgi:hypothetical protein
VLSNSCEHANELPGTIKDGEFHGLLVAYKLLKSKYTQLNQAFFFYKMSYNFSQSRHPRTG